MLTFSIGHRQSPIDIITKDVVNGTDTSITIEGNDIPSGILRYEGMSFTIKINVDDDIKVTNNDSKVYYRSREEISGWTLAQFHFHAPAEHHINGQGFALEMHSVFVNDANSTQLLVVGVVFEEDSKADDNEFIASLDLENVLVNPVNEIIDEVPMKDFYGSISKSQKYNYKGSLTTPACAEHVEWFVVKDVMKINSVQLERFTRHWAGNNTYAGGNGNNRLIQPLNRRKVFLTKSEDDGIDSFIKQFQIFDYINSILFSILIL